jgi:hypothetical protein
MRALFVTLVLAATATPVVHDQHPLPKPATADGTAHRTAVNECNCSTAYRTQRERELHQPSTPAERTETGRLNRDYLATARATPLPPPPGPDAAQLAYQQQLKNYRALTDSYERRMRDYRRLHPADQAYLPPSRDAHAQDAARLDPAQSGPGNGY